jgi:hypothetical protein
MEIVVRSAIHSSRLMAIRKKAGVVDKLGQIYSYKTDEL